MNDDKKTKEQLIQELEDLRRRIAELEKTETGRKRAEEELRESEEKYRSLAFTEDPMYFVDRECRYRFMNRAHLLRLGLSLEKVIGRSYGEFHSEENTKQFADRVEAVFATDNSFQTEHRSERDNKYFLRTFGPVKDLSGNITNVTVISKDITQRKQAEAALRESEEKYRTIIETMEEGYYEVDLAGNISFVNEAMLRITGRSKNELLGINYRGYSEETTTQKLKEAFKQIYLTGESFKGLEHEIITREGVRKNLEASVSLIKDHSGKPIGFRGISRDITRRKQAEAALKESEEKYRTIIETMEEGYYEVDLKGKLTFVNEALARMSGYSKSELLALNIPDYMDAETDWRLKQAYIRVFQTGESCKGIEHLVSCKGGTKKIIEASISLVGNPSGKPIGFRGITRDINDLRQTEKDLQNSEERFRIAAESSNDFIYEWDLKSGKIDWFGDSVEKLSHLLGEIPFTATAIGKIIYPDDYDHFLELIKWHLRHGGSYKDEYRIVGKDGRIIHIKSGRKGFVEPLREGI